MGISSALSALGPSQPRARSDPEGESACTDQSPDRELDRTVTETPESPALCTEVWNIFQIYVRAYCCMDQELCIFSCDFGNVVFQISWDNHISAKRKSQAWTTAVQQFCSVLLLLLPRASQRTTSELPARLHPPRASATHLTAHCQPSLPNPFCQASHNAQRASCRPNHTRPALLPHASRRTAPQPFCHAPHDAQRATCRPDRTRPTLLPHASRRTASPPLPNPFCQRVLRSPGSS